MKKKFLLLLILLIPSFTFASSKYITSSDGDIVLEKDASNSYLAVGDNVKINNKVDGLYGIFAKTIDYQSDNEYVIMAAESINVQGNIKDGALAARNIIFTTDAHIRRDVVLAGEEITLSGNYDGNVVVACKKVIIKDSTINGNIIMAASEIEIDDNSQIGGIIKYNKSAVANIGASLIEKTVIYNDISDTSEIKTESILITHLYKLISLFVILAALYLITPQLFDKFSDNIGKNFGYGAIALIGLPIPLVLLLFTRFGSSLAAIISILYIAIILSSKVIVGYEVGKLVYKKVFKKPIKKYLCGLVGITIIYLLSICPIIGGLVTFVILLYAFGIIINLIFSKKKK